MSLKTTKTILDQRLAANITDVPIKYENSSVYLLNSIPLTESEQGNLEFFISPRIVPVTQDDELLSSAEQVNVRTLYSVEIFEKKGGGNGNALDMEDRLNTIFRNQVVSTVICENTSVLSPFEDGEWYVTVWRVNTKEWE